MKSILFTFTLAVAITSCACKTKKATTATTATTTNSSTTGTTTTSNGSATMETGTTTTLATTEGAHVGKVSHKYRAGGCETVIIIPLETGDITLIPKDKLSKDVDVDGQKISFDYLPLKMPQPAGCTVGMPAEITNITKLK